MTGMKTSLLQHATKTKFAFYFVDESKLGKNVKSYEHPIL